MAYESLSDTFWDQIMSPLGNYTVMITTYDIENNVKSGLFL